MVDGENVELIIRSALQSFPDRTIQCSANWTILQLKEHLQKSLPFKPEVSRQRLIYAGHCLENSQVISTILKGRVESGLTDAPYVSQVIHLVYSSKEILKNIPSSSNPANTNEGIRFRGNNSSANNASQPVYPPTFNATNSLNAAQLNAQVPQNYHDYYMASYQNYMNQMMQFQQQFMAQQNGQMNFFQMPMIPQPANIFGENLPMFQFGQQIGGAPIALAAATFANLQNPAQGQMAINGPGNAMLLPVNNLNQPAENINAPAGNNFGIGEDGQNQTDILDLIYKSIRFLLLMMILYLYSSMERFFLVLLVISLIWFVQMHRERRNLQNQRNERHQPNVNNNNEPPQADNGNNANATENREEASTENATNEAAEALVQAASNTAQLAATTERAVSPWTVFWTTVSSFFASLIPENPVPLNAN